MTTPQITSNNLALIEATELPIGPGNLSAEADGTPPSSIIFDIVPATDPLGGSLLAGSFLLSGVPTTTFSQQDIFDGFVAFEQDGSEDLPQFTFTARVGADVSEPVPAQVTLTVINDPPIFSVNDLSISEGGTVVLNSDPLSLNLLTTDEESSASELVYTIDSVSDNGEFQLAVDGTPLPVGSTFTQAQVDAGEIQFVQDGSETAPTYALSVVDEEGSSGGSRVVHISDFSPTNDAPIAIADGPITAQEDTPLLITPTDNDTDVDGDTLTITAVDGTPVSPGGDAVTLTDGSVSLANDGVTLVFTPVANFVGEVVFGYTVSDGNEGTDISTVTVVVEPVNDGPLLTVNTLTLDEGQTVTLTLAENLNASDVDTALSLLEFEISNLSGGTFFVDGEVLSQGTPLRISDIALGLVTFEDDGDTVPPSYTVTVSDPEGASFTQDATINFTLVNDAPVIVNNTFTIVEGTPLTLNDTRTGEINLLAEDDTTPDSDLTYTVSNVTGGDFVDFLANPISSFTQQDLTDQAVLFLHDDSETAPTFDITVTDIEGASDTVTAEITFQPVDDEVPVLTTNRLSLFSGATTVLSASNLAATDLDTADESLVFTPSDITGGQFVVDDSAVTSFTQQQVTDGVVSFVHDGSVVPPSYSVAVNDSQVTTDPVAVTIDNFVPLNLNAISGGFITLEQQLQLDQPATPVAVTHPEIGGLALAQIFDESFYLAENPDIAAAIATGDINSAFEHFVVFGISEGRDPSILLDEAFYLATNPDVEAAVQAGSFSSGLEHFLIFGDVEGRDPSSLFDQSDYLINNPDVNDAVLAGAFQSGFEHYVEFGVDEARLPTLSLYNEAFYLENNPDVAAAVDAGAFADGFAHFVSFGQQEGRDPSTLFNQSDYLAANPDVAAAVQAGSFVSGFEHYEIFGRFEDRQIFV